MIVLLTGASGFIGRPLAARLVAEGDQVRILTRNSSGTGLDWTNGGSISDDVIQRLMNGVDAVIHLAGENIGSWPWSKARKRRIMDSRVLGTRALVQAFGRMIKPPQVFISASATGFYGDAGDRLCSEATPPGKGFLAEVVVAWETEIFKAQDLGIRTVAVRNGIVLGAGQAQAQTQVQVKYQSAKPLGALGKMLPSFRMGLGAVMGSGQQYYSWIHLEDTVGIFMHALLHPEVRGPLNACSPQPVTQNEFSLCLAKTLHRPRLFWIPAFVLRLILGGMADTVLEGQRVDASKILGLGYCFRYPTLSLALKNLLMKSPNR